MFIQYYTFAILPVVMNSPKSPESYPGHHEKNSGGRSNWLRAAVLGANDGVVSVASIVVGVAGASSSSGFIFTAGLAGLVAGACSMAVGEYVSVSTQRDTEQAMLARERYLLDKYPEEEKAELAWLYQAKGLTPPTAQLVADELSAKDAAAAHFEAELGVDPDDLTNPWQAAFASAAAFTAGGVVPLLSISLPAPALRLPFTFGAVILTLILTGILSAKASRANPLRATIRVVIGGVLAMIITFGIGRLFGVKGA